MIVDECLDNNAKKDLVIEKKKGCRYANRQPFGYL
jgi:hypothetical protein